MAIKQRTIRDVIADVRALVSHMDPKMQVFVLSAALEQTVGAPATALTTINGKLLHEEFWPKLKRRSV